MYTSLLQANINFYEKAHMNQGFSTKSYMLSKTYNHESFDLSFTYGNYTLSDSPVLGVVTLERKSCQITSRVTPLGL